MSAPSRVAALFAALLFAAGCNEGASVGGSDADPHAPDDYGVTGSVTYEGKSVDGEATFQPVDGGEAIKVPVKGGSYDARVPQGKYQVTVTGKAGETELPAGLTVERVVRPAAGGGQPMSLALPEEAGAAHDESTPEEARQLPASGAAAEGTPTE